MKLMMVLVVVTLSSTMTLSEVPVLHTVQQCTAVLIAIFNAAEAATSAVNDEDGNYRLILISSS